MHTLSFLTICLVSAILPHAAFAGNPRQITMEDGLPSNTVRSIVQGADGFVWLGSDAGLCRYDGIHARLFVNPLTGNDQYASALYAWGDNLLVGTSQGAFVLDSHTEQFSLLDEQINGLVTSFSVDADDNIWVATVADGLFCHLPHSATTKHFDFNNIGGNLSTVFVDRANQVWAIPRQGGKNVYYYNRARDNFECIPLPDGLRSDGLCLTQVPDGRIIIGTWAQGLIAISEDGTIRQLLNPATAGVGTHIHTLLPVDGNILLVGCDDGLISFDLSRESWSRSSNIISDANAADRRFIYSLMVDREGGLWSGSFYDGVSYFSPASQRFTPIINTDGAFTGRIVSRFAEDDAHRIWIASDDGGLNCFDLTNDRFVNFPGRNRFSQLNVHGLLPEGAHLWVGTYGDGLVYLDTKSGVSKTYALDDGSATSSCYALFRDSRNRLWAASMSRANIFDETDKVFRVAHVFNNLTIDIEEDINGDVWFATQGGGLWRQTVSGEWKHYEMSSNPSSLPSDQVNCLRRGSNGQLYVATQNGLCEYIPSSDSFRRIDVDTDKQDFSGMAVYQDELWLTSPEGVVRYSASGATQLYNRQDGLQDLQFQPNACHVASDGNIWLGLTTGICTFRPYRIKANKTEPPVFLTSISLLDKELTPGSDKMLCPLRQNGAINLNHDDVMFTINFAALSYVSPEKNQYAYTLEGFDHTWHNVGSATSATYTNIPAGSYTFRVRATNNDGVWSSHEARLAIVVSPPFYWSWPAKIFYILLAAALIYLFIRRQILINEKKHKEEIQRINETKDQEVRDARLRFFTTISHEIRTPVSLIIGPLENLMEQWDKVRNQVTDSQNISSTLDVINRNAHRLLDLINQLLDFNKVQREAQLHFRQHNIAKLIKSVAERFEPAMSLRKISLAVNYPPDDFSATIDQEGVTKILSNLMVNAMKYARTQVTLSCQIPDPDHFVFEVADDGPGVAPEEQSKIFAPFYQANDNKPGTGIGLSIVQTLVSAHHGTVAVSSPSGDGAHFIVTLPVSQSSPETEPSDEPSDHEDLVNHTSSAKPNAREADEKTTQAPQCQTVLVVDDDQDLRNFLESNLASHYSVKTAADGVEALRLLAEGPIDLIVSDWMMPEMDGAELCRRIRKDINVCHTPFIMLTAKTDDDSKAQSMDCGADTYIEKPFSIKYLLSSIRNLIEMRHLLQEKFSLSPTTSVSAIATSPLDDEFLNKMNKVIEDNMDNADLSVQFLASQMGVSRSALFLKIKSLAGITPNEMITLVRLKAAARMLREHRYRVNEICYRVGYNSPSYFSKSFQKQFGMKPLEYASAQ